LLIQIVSPEAVTGVGLALNVERGWLSGQRQRASNFASVFALKLQHFLATLTQLVMS